MAEDLMHFEESLSRTAVSNSLRRKEETTTIVSQLTKQAAKLRDTTGMLNLDAVLIHTDALKLLLATKADQKAKAGLPKLLAELTEDRGMGWSEIARMVGVSVPAIRKWRHGGDITPTRLLAVARLAAFLTLLEEQQVSDPAAWLATPLSDDLGVTKANLYVSGRAVELLAYAEDHMSLDDLLGAANLKDSERFSPNQLVRNDDGHFSIVPRED